ncbi:MAG: endonuclease, partial [Chloroflexota bacterium]
MTDHAQFLFNMILGVVNGKYSDVPPTIEELTADADNIREASKSLYPISKDEYVQVVKKLRENVLVTIGTSHSLRGIDVNHQSWYQTVEKDDFYWNRYKQYLETLKHWSKEVIRQLNDTTDSIMDDLGDPTKKKMTFSRRGLLLGDVQSGKTATYTAICNKAADCGYRVIIVLTGMLENLRFQTQERLDAEFAGRESRYALDRSADLIIREKAVGVGRIGPTNPDKRISCFTTVSTDFSRNILRSNDLTLRNISGTALFVV